MGTIRALNVIRVIAVLFIFSLAVGCGGGGGGAGDADQSDGGPQPQTEGLSTTTANPGQFITISSSSIKAGEPATVTFKGANGYELTVQAENTSKGSLRTAVPAFANPATATFGQGSVSVSVNGKLLSDTLTIHDLPDLGNIQGGLVLKKLLEKTRDNLIETRTSILSDTAVSGSVANASVEDINARLNRLEAMINEIGTSRTLTVTYKNGTTVTLQEKDLKIVDRMLGSTYSGIYEELLSRKLISPIQFKYDEDRPLSETIWARVDSVCQSIRTGLEGDNTLLEGLGVGVGIASLIVLGSEAALIAVPAGIYVAYVHAGFDLGTSAAYNRMIEGVRDSTSEAYDLGEKLWDHALSVGSAWVGAIDHWTAELYGDISEWIESFDRAEQLAEVKCGNAPFKSVMFKADPPDDLCAAFDPSAPPEEGKVFATVTIPDAGYSTWFVGKYVYAWLFLVDNVWEHTYYPQIVARSNPRGYVNPGGGMVLEDQITIALWPGLICSNDYKLEGSIEDGATVAFETNRFVDMGYGSYMTVNGTISLLRFGSQVGSRLKGSFQGDLLKEYTVWENGSSTKKQSWGMISGTFDVMIIDISSQSSAQAFSSAMGAYVSGSQD
jgi:hypothetical protein